MRRQTFWMLLCGLMLAPCILMAANYEPSILVNGTSISNGERSETIICLESNGTQVTLEVQNPDPSIVIKSVDWDFGDGVTLDDADPAQVQTRDYTVEGWYDVKAVLHVDYVYGGVIAINIAFRVAECPPQCLNFSLNREKIESYACKGENYEIPVSFSEGAVPGEVSLVFSSGEKQTAQIELADDESEEEGRVNALVIASTNNWQLGTTYTAHLQIEDINCERIVTTPKFSFSLRYPNTLFALKFNNVLAVYLRGKGGNPYNFTAYQWYRNGQAIEGATSSIYHSEAIFTPKDEYYVMLTDENDTTIPTCPYTIPDELDDYTPTTKTETETEPQAIKALVNHNMIIRLGETTYNIYGQRVQ